MRLIDIIVEEVSLVDKAANKREFLVVKADTTTQEVKSTDEQKGLLELKEALTDLSKTIQEVSK